MNALGIWNFSPYIELAQDFLAFLFERENFNAWITASFGSNQPPLRAFANHPIWQQDPKTAIIPKEGEYARARGWPAKPNEYVQLREAPVRRKPITMATEHATLYAVGARL